MFNSIWANHNNKTGNQKSLFSRVSWLERKRPLQCKFLAPPSEEFPNLFDIIFESYYAGDYITLNNGTFNGKSLELIRSEITPNVPFNVDGYWEATIVEDLNGRISLSDASVSKFMLMDLNDPDSGMQHLHPVFSKVEFKNFIVTIKVKEVNSGPDHFIKLYLDTDSNGNIKLAIPPNYTQIKRIVGTSGWLNNTGHYQIGICQQLLYVVKCGEKIINLNIDLSMVFMYPRSDFDPAGTVHASKFYPQIQFSSNSRLSSDIPSNYNIGSFTDITPYLPLNIDPYSAEVSDFSSRIRLDVNNNSEHHVIPTDNVASDGFKRDSNYLKKLRQSNKTIPDQFEKILKEDYIGTNIVGFYADSNQSGTDSNGAKDNRKKMDYDFDVTWTPDWAPGIQPSIFWQNIFDYANYNVKFEKEFVAVYGDNSDLLSSSNIGKNKEYRKTEYDYPSGNIGFDKITLNKYPRQGAFDNIHLHGYLGHYKDNDQLVIHAPICGYCCFHMHWRWSSFNYEVASNGWFQAGNKWGESLVNERNFLGYYDESSNIGLGMPLIPNNQQLKIAVTHPDSNPTNEEYDVVLNGSNTVSLRSDIKTIWYSVNLTNRKFEESHVIMEHGCGYAFDYDNLAKENIQGDLINILQLVGNVNPREKLKEVVSLIVSDVSFYIDFIRAIQNDFGVIAIQPDELLYPDLYELLYRLMHFYNIDSSGQLYEKYPQVPSNNNNPTELVYYDTTNLETQ